MEGEISSLMSVLPKIAGQVSFHVQCQIAETVFFKATCPYEILKVLEYQDYDI
jgi:hypothetical protein